MCKNKERGSLGGICMKVKQKILTGFPCNNGAIYMVMTEDKSIYTVTSKKTFEEAIKNGYIEIEEDKEK